MTPGMAQTSSLACVASTWRIRNRQGHYQAHGTAAAVRNCPTLTETGGGEDVGGGGARRGTGERAGHRTAFPHAKERRCDTPDAGKKVKTRLYGTVQPDHGPEEKRNKAKRGLAARLEEAVGRTKSGGEEATGTAGSIAASLIAEAPAAAEAVVVQAKGIAQPCPRAERKQRARAARLLQCAWRTHQARACAARRRRVTEGGGG